MAATISRSSQSASVKETPPLEVGCRSQILAVVRRSTALTNALAPLSWANATGQFCLTTAPLIRLVTVRCSMACALARCFDAMKLLVPPNRLSPLARATVIVVAALLEPASLAWAAALNPEEPAGHLVQQGFLTGLDYRNEGDRFRYSYAMGLLDGLFASVLFGASESAMLGIKHCFPRMSGTQLQAMLDKHIGDHPERWHDYARYTFLRDLA